MPVSFYSSITIAQIGGIPFRFLVLPKRVFSPTCSAGVSLGFSFAKRSNSIVEEPTAWLANRWILLTENAKVYGNQHSQGQQLK